MQDWGALPNVGFEYTPRAVSDDGAIAAGRATTVSPNPHAVLWTRQGGAQDLGYIDESGQDSFASAYDMNGAGSLVVGGTTDGGFICDQEAGMRIISASPPFVPFFTNPDGTVMAGGSSGLARWSAATGVEVLHTQYRAEGMSDDGNVIIVNPIDGSGAARWTRETGFVPIPSPAGQFPVHAVAANPDATLVVGYTIRSAWIWHEGILNAELGLLLPALGVDLSDWSELTIATGVSDDGSVIVGWGYRVNEFERTGWLVRLRPGCGTADYNHDGDTGTDLDIEDFFACLAGNCCDTCYTCDFNGDGQSGQDTDIEAFFRVLGGNGC